MEELISVASDGAISTVEVESERKGKYKNLLNYY